MSSYATPRRRKSPACTACLVPVVSPVDFDKSALWESVMNLRVPSGIPYDVIYAIVESLDRPRDIYHFALAILGTKYHAFVGNMLRMLYRRDVELQQYLLDRPEEALENGPPALLWAAKRYKHATMTHALEANKRSSYPPSYMDGLNYHPYRPKPGEKFNVCPKPPLLVCAGQNDVRGCQLLLKYGADISIRWLNHRDGWNKPWRSPFPAKRDHCFRGTHKHCVSRVALPSAKCIFSSTQSALFCMRRLLIPDARQPHYSSMCLTALSEAAGRGCVCTVKYLVKAGAETTSTETIPPLHMAVIHDQVQTVQALLEIDPGLTNFRTLRHGDHPLTVATNRFISIQDVGYLRIPSLKGARICQLLLDYGAYVDARVDDDAPFNTPLIYAASNGFRAAEAGSYRRTMLWAIYCTILLRAGACRVPSAGRPPQFPETKGPGIEILQWLDCHAASKAVQDGVNHVEALIERC